MTIMKGKSNTICMFNIRWKFPDQNCKKLKKKEKVNVTFDTLYFAIVYFDTLYFKSLIMIL